jgi:hypothetical protein
MPTIYPYTWFAISDTDRHQVANEPGLETLKGLDTRAVATLCLAPVVKGWPAVVFPTGGGGFKVSAEREVGGDGIIKTVAVLLETESARHWLLPSGKTITTALECSYEQILLEGN